MDIFNKDSILITDLLILKLSPLADAIFFFFLMFGSLPNGYIPERLYVSVFVCKLSNLKSASEAPYFEKFCSWFDESVYRILGLLKVRAIQFVSVSRVSICRFNWQHSVKNIKPYALDLKFNPSISR